MNVAHADNLLKVSVFRLSVLRRPGTVPEWSDTQVFTVMALLQSGDNVGSGAPYLPIRQ